MKFTYFNLKLKRCSSFVSKWPKHCLMNVIRYRTLEISEPIIAFDPIPEVGARELFTKSLFELQLFPLPLLRNTSRITSISVIYVSSSKSHLGGKFVSRTNLALWIILWHQMPLLHFGLVSWKPFLIKSNASKSFLPCAVC